MDDINKFEQETGVGKTMNACYIVNRFFELTTNNFYDESEKKFYSLGLVFSTCHMFFNEKLNPYFRKDDFIYTELGLLPLWKFDEFNKLNIEIPICVIYDDYEHSRMFIERVLKFSTSWKRKYHIEFNFIGHYNKNLNKQIREVCDNRYILNIYGNNIEGILYKKYREIDDFGIEREYEMPIEFVIKDVVDDLKKLYNTNEVVNPITPYRFEKEILENCKGMSYSELQDVLICFIGNKTELEKKIEYFSEKLNIVK